MVQRIIDVRNRARFVPPSSSALIVARDRLDGLYAEATGRVLRVIAAPGYGKSTQVGRWVEADGRHIGWIDLERIDNDPLVLASAIARALGVNDRLPRTWPEAVEGSSPVDQIVATLGALAEEAERPYVLVLDDLHNVDSADSVAVVDAVIEHLPSTCTVVLSGRAHPDRGALARHRLRPGVVDIGADHLSLDPTETDDLLRAMGVTLELDALSRVCERFEGWAAGLRLAGLALRDEGERSWMSAEHVGDTTFIVDYLRSEWTGRLSPADRQFLCEAACLQRFTGPMCDEILGTTRSLARLRRMHNEELLVLPLDQRDEWFRMHPLLTRWLSADLQESDPERWRAIHGLVAEWWRERGDIDLAFEHALAGGDLGTAERLVAEHGFVFLARGLRATVHRWLEVFPPEVVQRSAGLCAVNALDALQAGEGARSLHWYEALDRVVDTAPSLEGRRAQVLRITLAREPAAILLPVAESACRELEGESWTALALYATGGLRFLAGDERAGEAFEGAAFLAELNEMWVHQANCTSALGIVCDLAGDRDGASEAARRSAEVVARLSGQLPATMAISDALQALIAARAGRREAAASFLESGRKQLEGFSSVAPWFNVLCGLALSRAALLIDDRSASRELLRDLDLALRIEAATNGAAAHVAALRESVDAARNLPSDPAWALTDAEIKVLQHLPTNLTLADIATRLFVSRNTVKSHVAAIYRKLDATSRSDAVDLARRTGLLDEGPAEGRD